MQTPMACAMETCPNQLLSDPFSRKMTPIAANRCQLFTDGFTHRKPRDLRRSGWSFEEPRPDVWGSCDDTSPIRSPITFGSRPASLQPSVSRWTSAGSVSFDSARALQAGFCATGRVSIGRAASIAHSTCPSVESSRFNRMVASQFSGSLRSYSAASHAATPPRTTTATTTTGKDVVKTTTKSPANASTERLAPQAPRNRVKSLDDTKLEERRAKAIGVQRKSSVCCRAHARRMVRLRAGLDVEDEEEDLLRFDGSTHCILQDLVQNDGYFGPPMSKAEEKAAIDLLNLICNHISSLTRFRYLKLISKDSKLSSTTLPDNTFRLCEATGRARLAKMVRAMNKLTLAQRLRRICILIEEVLPVELLLECRAACAASGMSLENALSQKIYSDLVSRMGKPQ